MQGRKRRRVVTEKDKMTDVVDYEQVRNARIEDNRRRMQELGLFNLSTEISKEVSQVRKKRVRPPVEKQQRDSTPPPSRRSSRLQNVSSINYAELPNPNWNEKLDTGHKPEIYTDEHEKLLGSYESEWVLFQDGYGPDGSRIYDCVKGKTCHQCRQKTLGLRTRCSTCDLVQGQFCGDCLYTRYGENILEVNKNPAWVCPVCRNICNCSLCRIKKGWAPTGYLYRKVRSQGFKSVAHYLILTRRSSTNSESTDTTSNNCHIEDNKDDAFPNGARRSLTFASKGEGDDCLPKLESCKREDNFFPNSTCCKTEENDSLLNSVCHKTEENDSLPNLASFKREEKESFPNLVCCKIELGQGEDSCIYDTKSMHANEIVLSKVASQNGCVDVEVISIEEESEEDKTQRRSTRCNVHVRGGIAKRLRPRTTRNITS